TEVDDLNIWGQYSTDTGTSWKPMSIMEGDGSVYTATGGSYPTSLTWQSFDDLGYTNLGGVLFRMFAADNDTSGAADSSTFNVINYVGDYSGDTVVNFADFATLVTAWNDQDTYHDIGPATGSVPNLQPDYDGLINFEDLAVYAMMWTWSDAGSGASTAAAQIDHTLGRPLVALGDAPAQSDTGRQHPVILNQPEPEDLWAPDNGMLEVALDARNVVSLTSAGIVLRYDTEHLEFIEVVPGSFLGRTTGDRQSQLFMKRVKGELGLIELMFGRIQTESPEASGNGRLATVRFRKLSRENSAVRVSYDLKNRRAETVTAGTYETSVAAIRVPKDFELLQNYPNPFNGETMIRFQLPAQERVQLYVYNIRGQRVATIIDEQMDAGYHRITWNGRNDDGRKVGSGVYIYLIQAGPHRQSKKLTYVK
ncbi:FlgD immunoglobulin-like domain containing protein, partial [Gemmatimonadota bacterium]